MDTIDRNIAQIVQKSGRTSSAAIAEAVGVSVSTANERVRRLSKTGVIKAWRGVLDPDRLGLGLCAFVFVDISYDGEEAARAKLNECPEVQELHHVSGAHGYLLKVRVADTAALQGFLQEHVKPLQAVYSTESFLVLSTTKETTELPIGAP